MPCGGAPLPLVAFCTRVPTSAAVLALLPQAPGSPAPPKLLPSLCSASSLHRLATWPGDRLQGPTELSVLHRVSHPHHPPLSPPLPPSLLCRGVRTLLGIDPSASSLFEVEAPGGADGARTPDGGRAASRVAQQQQQRPRAESSVAASANAGASESGGGGGTGGTVDQRDALEEARLAGGCGACAWPSLHALHSVCASLPDAASILTPAPTLAAAAAVEQIVIPRCQPVELLPRTGAILELQAQLVQRVYDLPFELIGGTPGSLARLRVLPPAWASAPGGASAEAAAVAAAMKVAGAKETEFW